MPFVFPRLSRRRMSLLAASCLVVWVAGVMCPVPAMEAPPIETIRFPNGHTLYVQENHDQPIVTIDTWVKTGSVNEVDANNGVSHFLEHLIFKGSENYPEGALEKLLGAKGAVYNAATSDDYTHFYIIIGSRFFEEALKIHADVLLHAQIPEDALNRERKVVQEEINRALDNPQRKMLITLSSMLFGEHGYAYDTLGPKSVIENIPRQDILNYYHYWYRPEFLNTVIAGDVDTENVKRLIEKYFAPPNATFGNYEPPVVETVPQLKQPVYKVMADEDVDQAYLAVCFIGPGMDKKEDTYALDVAMMALGSGRSSRLYRTLREKQSIVNDVSAGNFTQKYAGILYVMTEQKPENVAHARDEVLKFIRGLQLKGITEEELAQAKTQTIRAFVYNQESTQGTAQSIGYNVTIGELEDYTDYVNQIQQVSLADVKDVLNRYLTLDRVAVVEMLPQERILAGNPTEAAEEKAMAADVNRWKNTVDAKKPPKTLDVATAVEKTVLKNGMTLLMKPSVHSDTVSIRVMIKGGQLVEPIPGVSALTAAMLTKGTQARDAGGIAKELESKGIELGAQTTRDYLEVRGHSIAEDFGELFLVMQDVLTHPAFEPDKLAREKDHLRQSLQASREQPSDLAFENLSLALYPWHPYGNVGKRIEQHLDLIEVKHLRDYMDRYAVPENMVVSVVGNVSPKLVQQYLLAAFPSGMNAKSDAVHDPLTTAECVAPLKEDVTVRGSKEKQAATWIVRGWLAPDISSGDYAALKVLDGLLGSGMDSRLFVNIREKKGLAYTVGSFYPSAKRSSHFVIYLGTDPKNQDAVLAAFDAEIKDLQEHRVPEDELQAAKDKLVGSFALAHETNEDQAFYLGLYELLGRGYRFDTEYPALIQEVTAAQIQAVAQKYFSRPSVQSIVAPAEKPAE